MDTKATDIDGYLATVPEQARATLEELRRRISALAPDAVEAISYGLPTFKYLGRPLVAFGSARKHCALYGMSAVLEAHRDELASYDTSKGAVRFPPGEPPPEALLKTLVRARIAEIEADAARRKGKKSG